MELTKKQQDMLWGGDGPYSQVKLMKETRILDDNVSRIFLVVEAEINPTTFKLVKKHRKNKEFINDPMVQQLLDHADYRGLKFGYVSMAFSAEYGDDVAMINAEQALRYSQKTIIKMHKFVIGLIKK
jgi:hypothetical protein